MAPRDGGGAGASERTRVLCTSVGGWDRTPAARERAGADRANEHLDAAVPDLVVREVKEFERWEDTLIVEHAVAERLGKGGEAGWGGSGGQQRILSVRAVGYAEHEACVAGSSLAGSNWREGSARFRVPAAERTWMPASVMPL